MLPITTRTKIIAPIAPHRTHAASSTRKMTIAPTPHAMMRPKKPSQNFMPGFLTSIPS
jgi:hypothetical protein